jgi:flagellar biosynthesis protein FliQ
MDWQALIFDPSREMLTRIANFIPTLIGASVILILGWIIAKVIKGIVNRLLLLIRFDAVTEKAGVSDILSKGGIRLSARQMISALCYWLVMIMVLVMVVNALGLTVASQLLESLLAYIPKVIAAIFVLVLGMFLGNILSGVVRTAASNANLPKADMLGHICQWAIVIFAATIALKQLGIAPLLVTATFNILFGGICLALAIAFGLGGKEMAAKYLEELKKKYSK